MAKKRNRWYNNYSLHHRIPKALFGSDHYDNLVQLQNGYHSALHKVTDQPDRPSYPHEQLLKILDINKPALNPRYVRELEELIRDEIGYIYKNSVFRRDVKIYHEHGIYNNGSGDD